MVMPFALLTLQLPRNFVSKSLHLVRIVLRFRNIKSADVDAPMAIDAKPHLLGLGVYFLLTGKGTSMHRKTHGSDGQSCPHCGIQLKAEQDMLRCPEHGTFFAYGPSLVIRAPRTSDAQASALMPWEVQAVRSGD